MQITIRPVDTIEGVQHFQRLEQMIWHSPALDVVPVHVAITAVRNGGGLLGAFAPDGPEDTGGMVGLTFWWPGLGTPSTGHSPGQPQPKMCSHMAGVLPAWQGQGIGLQLKLAQRRAILEQGWCSWVTWTYDPLFRTNGVFNIHRLGAVCQTYRRDWYGVMLDGLNAGVPSDRCQVDWWLTSERVVAAAALADSPRRLGMVAAPDPALCMLPTTSAGSFRAPVEDAPPVDGRPLAVPIPDDIAAIRREDPALGMAWRLYMRHTLEAAFAAGYVMVDCVALGGEWYYVLASA